MFFLLILLPFTLFAKQSICLNMIVKDEKDVIRRCLDSVKPIIDYWVILDTGSTDGTQAIIKKHLRDIPGELYETTWKNWGETRSEAFNLAKDKGDYILFMDADDILEFNGEPTFPELTADLYHMWRGSSDFSYLKPQIAKGDLHWKWVGVTHEYLGCDDAYTSDTLTNVKYTTREGGATHKDPTKKFWTNVHLLEEGLKEEPDNARYAFYLAESYRDAGEPGKALQWFQKRIDMGGWSEEMFWSKLQIALMLQRIGLPSNIVNTALIDAHIFRPHRVEPIYYLAENYNQEENYGAAYQWLKSFEYIPKADEKDALFNMDWMNQYGTLFQLSIAAYYVEEYQEAIDACNKLLTISDLPESWRARTILNREFPLKRLEEIAAAETSPPAETAQLDLAEIPHEEEGQPQLEAPIVIDATPPLLAG
jgi:glycosyltransferase involved in cell wall biosynthesis